MALGHRVTYAVGDRLVALVEPTGAEVIGHPSGLPDADAAWPDDPGAAMQLFLDDQLVALPRLLALHGRPTRCSTIGLSPTYAAWEGYEDTWPSCLDDLARDHRLELATGKVDPATLGPLPAGVEAQRTQTQLDVLAHADVFVTHAGMGGAGESLWLGVPTVAIPQAVDQFANAERLEALGCGVQVPATT